jgi:hypothetical protein
METHVKQPNQFTEADYKNVILPASVKRGNWIQGDLLWDNLKSFGWLSGMDRLLVSSCTVHISSWGTVSLTPWS